MILEQDLRKCVYRVASAKKNLKVFIFYEKSTGLPKNYEKLSVKTQGFGKIMQNHRSKTLYFTRYSANRCLAHSQNTIHSQN